MSRYVYAFEDERGSPCYIGVGTRDRISMHRREAERNPKASEFYGYLADCALRGIKLPAYKVAEDLAADQAYSYEQTLIAWYGRRCIGTGNLFNIHVGGQGGSRREHLLTSTREKLSAAARKARPKTQEELAAMLKLANAANLGKKRSMVTCARMSASARKSGDRTEAQAAAIASNRVARIGMKDSDEVKARRNAANKGQKRSPEARERMRTARLAYLARTSKWA
jgi:hypothetical protein